MLPRVVLIRHGESVWNNKNLFCGWFNAPLSDAGKRDAVTISAAALKENSFKFDVAFTSCLDRAYESARMILDEMGQRDQVEIRRDWRLNERHYGALTGFNKREMADVYGEQQVQVWRRSFDVSPPRITPLNPYYEAIMCNPQFSHIPPEVFPEAETLATTMERVLECWATAIEPEIRAGRRVLIVAHGTSLRGLVKHLSGFSNEQIMKFNLPNSIPCYYDLDPVTLNSVNGLRFLADDKTVMQAMGKVASIGEK